MTIKRLIPLWIVCACMVCSGCAKIDTDSILYTCSTDEQDPCGSGYFCGPDRVCHPLGFNDFDVSDTTTDAASDTDANDPCADCGSDKICLDGQCLIVQQLALGAKHSCARFDTGQVACWGDNKNYQTNPSANTTDSITRPQLVNIGEGKASKICAGDAHTCALVQKSPNEPKELEVHCWGDTNFNQLGVADQAAFISPNLYTIAQLSGNIIDLACGASHTCAILNNQVYCWGDNSENKLGDEVAAGDVPVSPSDLAALIPSATDNIEAIAAGKYHTCLLHKEGQSITCWGGHNDVGQLGREPTGGVSTPETVDISAFNASSMSASASNTCIVDSVGSARCLGGNMKGQLGYGGSDTATRTEPSLPVQRSVSPGSAMARVLEIDSGEDFSCAIVEISNNRQVFCWGSNDKQQIAQPVNTPSVNRAVQVSDLTDIGQIATGGAHACAVKLSDSSVVCWGANAEGQLGDGTTSTSSKDPKPVF